MKTLVNPPLEKNIVVDRSPLWRRISAEQLYRLLSLISPILALLTWQFICSLQIFPTQILVPPATVWNTFIGLLQSGELQLHLKDSLARLFFGFSIAATAPTPNPVCLISSRRVILFMFSPLNDKFLIQERING